ncbi:acyltransferase family protein [Neobacillus kokaensis]|uniref:acyltransferase family protein n=1 Tax=Neobacillus kokaensis TaxID=2759023 RepID=UPI00174B0EB0|nr:acyltransferase [Neobacillus kokaensis]
MTGYNLKIKYDERQLIYIIKAFAIISVIIAHVSSTINNLNLFFANLGTLGVVQFFILSGYLFGKSNDSFKVFLSKKKSIILPWLISGFALYLLTQFWGSEVESIGGYKFLLYLLGVNSYLYYLTMLIICYFLFFRSKNNFILIISIIITIFSIYLTAYNKITFISPYVNPLNWIGFFTFGVIIRKNWSIYHLFFLAKKYIIFIFCIFMLCLILSVLSNKAYYWTSLSIPLEISGGSLVLILAHYTLSNKLLKFIGKQSFSIYLLHMPLAGLSNTIFDQILNWYNPIIKASFVLIIIVLLLYIVNKIASFNKKIFRFFYYCIGFR